MSFKMTASRGESLALSIIWLFCFVYMMVVDFNIDSVGGSFFILALTFAFGTSFVIKMGDVFR